jgi:PleD family two-component response regulator
VSYLLFVDDNEGMRQMVCDLLTASGHEVALAPDGPSALRSIQEREPDLVILDRSMPGMSGIEVCRAIKQNPFTEQIPVLMLTAESRVASKVEGFEAGADDYLGKPFDPRELRARVKSLLRLVRREGDRNPTSGLPGGRAIEAEVARRVAGGRPFAVVYIDIDNFKPFCDTFGFSVADRVIHDTGRALREAVEAAGGGRGEDFVGHIGGDDFIVVTREDRAESIARECARRFREVIGEAVGDEALERGEFAGVDRGGVATTFPIARMTAAVLSIHPERWVSATHMGTLAADVKRRARERGAGTILVETV